MFHSIRNYKNHIVYKGIIGFLLVGVTLSFPLSTFTFATENLNRTRPMAEKRVIEKPLIAKPASDEQKDLIPGDYNETISKTATKPIPSIGTPVKSQRSVWNNPGSRSWNVDKAPVSQRTSIISERNIYLLARVIHAEARGEPLEGQVAVGAVLLNRLQDKRFPKTLSQIIFKQGEFCTVRDGQIWMNPGSRAVRAARLAASGWDPTGGAVYFYNPAKTTSSWIWSRPVVNQIGNHIFAI